MQDIDKYAKMILVAEPDFVEPKGFMHVGEAQKRLPRSMMPTHREVTAFAQELTKLINYEFEDHSPQSRVVLLAKT